MPLTLETQGCGYAMVAIRRWVLVLAIVHPFPSLLYYHAGLQSQMLMDIPEDHHSRRE